MSQIILYKNELGSVKVDVLLEDETVWLTQGQMAELFGKSTSTINEHIKNVFDENELKEGSVMRKFGISEFSTKPTNFYNLDMILAVGYRVKSRQGTDFRIWATEKLKEYIIKGFTLNDERFKTGSSMNYFKELLDRIREIRISEKVFYQQIKDIYALSVDYDPSSEMTTRFFKAVQNKLLWAVSEQTAAELIYYRANATLPQMGLTSTKTAGKVLKADTEVAKNYLNAEEMQQLKLIVEQFLAYAESQAMAQKPMTQQDWLNKLGALLEMNDKEVLTHLGKISHNQAIKHANEEYDKYKQKEKELIKLESIKELERDIKKLKE